MSEEKKRPPFILSVNDVEERSFSYPNSSEKFTHSRAIGIKAGLLKIGLHYERLLPGHRSCWPHAEEKEEEFVFVIEGEVLAWVDGEVYPMRAGDLAAFPSGTGIAHVFINDSDKEAILLVGGEAGRRDSRIFYPLNPGRKNDMSWSAWWNDVPKRELGPHDAMPKKRD